MRSCLALAFGVALIAGCATSQMGSVAPTLPATTAGGELAISGVRVEPKTLDLSQPRAGALVSFQLSDTADIWLEIVDDEGRLVRRTEPEPVEFGRRSLGWNGRADDDTPVPNGVYRYVIHAKAPDGREAVYNPSTETGGEELTARNFTFDRPTATLGWVMPKAGRVRLRIGLKGFPHLRTLLDWQPMEAGAQQLAWDGLDASGLIRAIDHPELSLNLAAFALPDNTIIIRGSQSSIGHRQWKTLYAPNVHPSGYFHAKHPRAECREGIVRVEFPETFRKDAQGRVIVRGKIPVRVTLEGPTAARFVNQRFEVVLFEDLIRLFEEEQSLNPYTFLWDTTRLTPGEHLLTVDILSYDDHYAVATLPILVER
ncbi:MAG: hypothetical protein HY737_08320 [Candidatus Omnitrophica bacterium]|nr:hypothetical protein [Candidatus Omnitrophota bacterium]